MDASCVSAFINSFHYMVSDVLHSKNANRICEHELEHSVFRVPIQGLLKNGNLLRYCLCAYVIINLLLTSESAPVLV